MKVISTDHRKIRALDTPDYLRYASRTSSLSSLILSLTLSTFVIQQSDFPEFLAVTYDGVEIAGANLDILITMKRMIQ